MFYHAYEKSKWIIQRKTQHVLRFEHNVTLSTMRLNNSTFIFQNHDKHDHESSWWLKIKKNKNAASVNKGKKAPGMHIHKAIREGMEKLAMMLKTMAETWMI